MAKRIDVEGFEAFIKSIKDIKDSKKDIFVLFSGSKDPKTGSSWCPDCVVAAPVIDNALKKASEDSYFIYVSVGPREFWKDQNNVFRKDSRTRLTCVPTLLKYGTAQRLEEGQCAKLDMVEMLFED